MSERPSVCKCADLAVRAARAEIERDAALAQAKSAQESFFAVMSGDKEKILDTLHIIGIPAREFSDIYRIEQEWLSKGGRPSVIEDFVLRERLFGLLWNMTKEDSKPLWWCLDDDVKKDFRDRVIPAMPDPIKRPGLV